MELQIFGIRHHGPGSAKSLKLGLEKMQPDLILIEGPTDANDMLHHVMGEGMVPPVALLVFNPKETHQAAYFPFATFSPEWQAFLYGGTHGVPARFMDLPQQYQFNLSKEDYKPGALEEGDPALEPIIDPLSYLAKMAGYEDSERWWEVSFEHREEGEEVFPVILELMTALRENAGLKESRHTLLREAFMRKSIRKAQKEGFQKIAVVCGAWHSPVLDPSDFKIKDDNAILKGLKKVNTKATWIPWSFKRLSVSSGYGAGVISPAWYELLFENREKVVIHWMTLVARMLREEDLDASSAHVIEAVRLADTLATIRNLSIPGIGELQEAVRTIFCSGYDAPMKLIEETLVIGKKIGQVANDIPLVPIQEDLEKYPSIKNKNGQLHKTYTSKEDSRLELNIRVDSNLNASLLLHRLNILDIPWGKMAKVATNKKGSFHEVWELKWEVTFPILIIEAGMWGNTIVQAASTYIGFKASKASQLHEVTALLNSALYADLPACIPTLIQQLDEHASVTNDIGQLMKALPGLVRILKMGSTRKINTESVEKVVSQLIPRICISLPSACISLNEEAAQAMFSNIVEVNRAVIGLDHDPYSKVWTDTLSHLALMEGGSPLICGASARILFDKGIWDLALLDERMRYNLSQGNDSKKSAFWVEGFLFGSGLLLIHQPRLWAVLDDWIGSLKEETFNDVLPLLRRTFSGFSESERSKMLDLAKREKLPKSKTQTHGHFDEALATHAVSTVQLLLGIK